MTGCLDGKVALMTGMAPATQEAEQRARLTGPAALSDERG